MRGPRCVQHRVPLDSLTKLGSFRRGESHMEDWPRPALRHCGPTRHVDRDKRAPRRVTGNTWNSREAPASAGASPYPAETDVARLVSVGQTEHARIGRGGHRDVGHGDVDAIHALRAVGRGAGPRPPVPGQRGGVLEEEDRQARITQGREPGEQRPPGRGRRAVAVHEQHHPGRGRRPDDVVDEAHRSLGIRRSGRGR